MPHLIGWNRSPMGKWYNVLFGLAHCADGLVRVLSLGFLASSFTLTLARNNARRFFKRQFKYSS